MLHRCSRTVIAILTLTFSAAASVPARAAAAATAGAAQKACTVEQGQLYIDEGRYDRAVREFTCVIDDNPTGVDGYRGRIEALLLLGRYSDAVTDYVRGITALVLPVHPDAATTILDGYADRLAAAPDNLAALTGASFARWWFFQYSLAIPVLDHLLALQPNDVYGNLFRGSCRMLLGANAAAGAADLEQAIALAPTSPDVRFIVADAYTYGQPDPDRAFAEASLALTWGLNTPRVNAILAAAYNAFGDLTAAAGRIHLHIQLVTTELLATSPIAVGSLVALPLVPGRTYEIPVSAAAGETISIATSSHDFTDTILVLLAPNGSPVIGSDDANRYFAAIEFGAGVSGTYRMQVTSFESASMGELLVKRR